MSKLVLIDGNAIMHRAYHALPPLTTKHGEPIGAVYGFITMLLRVIEDLGPTHIAVSFDRKEPTFRQKLHVEYQAQRPQMHEDLSGQFEKVKKVIDAFGIPIYEKAGFEADDVIGTISKNEDLDEVNIVTGDRDILQLVTDKIKVYMPVKGIIEGKLFGKEEVIEKMGIEPEQIVDYKALVGDPSDNYKGVPGIGPKTAENLLKKYLTLERIYENLEEIQPKLREKLEDGQGSAELSQKLAQIVRDVPIDFDVEKAGKWKIDSKEAFRVFADFGFKTIPKRVQKVAKEIDSKKQMELL